MAPCLLECLCEADLQHYYHQFVAVGLQKIEELAKVTMKDYSKLGVYNMEDRKRLFQLIKIIQSVAAEEEEEVQRTPLQPGCVYLHPQSARSGTRRQLQFDAYDIDGSSFSPSMLSPPRPVRHPAELYDMAPPNDQRDNNLQKEAPSLSSDLSSYRAQRGVAPAPRENEGPVIHRVMHVSGYNYGVPQPCPRSSIPEKEEPWTDSDKIKVCVRKRPLGLREERRGEVSVVTMEGREAVLIHEKKEAVNLKEYILQHIFYFDEVFSETFTNQDVYMKTAQPLIQHVFNGGNATCFAYGQTGAGKTYTMIGTQKCPGLYALAARDIFKQLQSTQPCKDLSVWISFYEIYCGQLYDLLNGRKRLYAREDGKHVVQVVGLRDVQVHGVEFLLEMIAKGSRERSTGATGVNSDSSRSHAIIQIQIKDGGKRKLGRMSFIDLAGSERAADARESDKQTKMEGAEINQSLLALKECIRALDQEQAHTPFRQSKLTQVLKDSFIGNSKTCMIANISPSHVATEHTLNTLRYADRVKELKRGMKNIPPCSNRSKGSSPKRIQNASSAAMGEKISPKKVKLGVQSSSTSNTTRARSSPSVFHPTNVPMSSTPKISSKPNNSRGSPNQSWLAHTTPVKGIVRLEKYVTRKCENQERKPQGLDTDIKVHSDHNGHLAQRVQAVVPVQKQIVSRAAMPLREKHSQPDNSNNNNEPHPSGDGGQKGREEHLKHYHQQFQQPPILYQKLQYQPLEKILGRYKPQEILVGHINSSEGLPQDDPDDSDFSEDSFSYTSGQKKGKKEELVQERLSFFLHQSSSSSADSRKITGRRQEDLSENPGPLDQKQSVSCECSAICALSERTRERVCRNLWSSEEVSDCGHDSSAISAIPEKPYSSQEERQSPLGNMKSSLSTWIDTNGNAAKETFDRLHLISGPQSSAATSNWGQSERETQNTSSDSSALMAPLTVSLLRGSWSSPELWPHSTPKPDCASKNESFDKSFGFHCQMNSQSVESNLSALVKKMLQYNESLQLQNSRQEHLLDTSSESKQLGSTGSPSSVGHQGSCNKNLPKSSNSGLNDSSTSGPSIDFLTSRSCKSQCYEADVEESMEKYSGYQDSSGRNKPEESNEASCRSQSDPHKTSSVQSICDRPASDPGFNTSKDSHNLPFRDGELEDLKHKLLKCIFGHQVEESRIEKTSKTKSSSSHLKLSHDTWRSGRRDFEKAQHLLRQAHCKQLIEVSALCCQEEALLIRLSGSDFPEYVKKLDDILLQKTKLIETLRADLQLFLDLPPGELSALCSGLDSRGEEAGPLCCS